MIKANKKQDGDFIMGNYDRILELLQAIQMNKDAMVDFLYICREALAAVPVSPQEPPQAES